MPHSPDLSVSTRVCECHNVNINENANVGIVPKSHDVDNKNDLQALDSVLLYKYLCEHSNFFFLR